MERRSAPMAARITLGHFSISSAMSLPKSVGEPLPYCPCSKSPQGRGRLVIFTSRPYRDGHGDDSLCRCIDLTFPFSQPRRARTQAPRSSASAGRSAPTTPRSTSALSPGSASRVLLYRIWPQVIDAWYWSSPQPWSSGIAKASDSFGGGDPVVRDGPGSVQKSVI